MNKLQEKLYHCIVDSGMDCEELLKLLINVHGPDFLDDNIEQELIDSGCLDSDEECQLDDEFSEEDFSDNDEF